MLRYNEPRPHQLPIASQKEVDDFLQRVYNGVPPGRDKSKFAEKYKLSGVGIYCFAFGLIDLERLLPDELPVEEKKLYSKFFFRNLRQQISEDTKCLAKFVGMIPPNQEYTTILRFRQLIFQLSDQEISGCSEMMSSCLEMMRSSQTKPPVSVLRKMMLHMYLSPGTILRYQGKSAMVVSHLESKTQIRIRLDGQKEPVDVHVQDLELE